jgi:ribosomal protein L11 methyltransferase
LLVLGTLVLAVSEPAYPYIAVDLAAADADEAGARLFELGAQGVELRDEGTLAPGGRAPGEVTLRASFSSQEDAQAALGTLPPEWSPRLEHVVGDGWRDEWKRYFEPFALCRGVVVRPPWRPHDPASDEQVIVLEPGRAFGTGLHETTRLVAGILADHADELRGGTLLDVGCGSGILSLAALALGAAFAFGIDVDPEATAAARENAERNRLGARMKIEGSPLAAIADRYRVVVANIETGTLVELAPALSERVAAYGMLVLSGILAEDAAPAQLPRVREAYCERSGLHLEEVRREGEWVALVLRAQGTHPR